MRRRRLNSGYSGNTDQRSTMAGTISASKNLMERSLGLFGPSLWSPAQITTALWLDASDISTISVDTGVSQWRDKSGNAQHVLQTTGPNQPAYTVGVLNGLNVLTFDGPNDFMSNTTYEFPTVYSIYVVGRGSANSYSRLLNVGTGDVRGFLGTGPSNSNYATFFGNGASWNDILSNTPNQSITSTSILGVVKDNEVAGATPYVNGIAQNTKNGTTTTATGFILGSSPGGGSQHWNGIIAEVIIQFLLSTNLQRLLIEGYLAHKWGLQANLPNDHPYKNAAPTL